MLLESVTQRASMSSTCTVRPRPASLQVNRSCSVGLNLQLPPLLRALLQLPPVNELLILESLEQGSASTYRIEGFSQTFWNNDGAQGKWLCTNCDSLVCGRSSCTLERKMAGSQNDCQSSNSNWAPVSARRAAVRFGHHTQSCGLSCWAPTMIKVCSTGCGDTRYYAVTAWPVHSAAVFQIWLNISVESS